MTPERVTQMRRDRQRTTWGPILLFQASPVPQVPASRFRASITVTGRNPTLAERKKWAEWISRGTEAWHLKADGTKELVRGAVIQPRTRATAGARRNRNPIDLDTYKARAWALRSRQTYRRR
jgi:hypothetical protein